MRGFVPSPALLALFAALAVPALTLLFAGVAAGICVALLAVLLATSAVDALFAGRRIRALHVSGPELVRLWKDRAGSIDLVFHSQDNHARIVRMALALPDEIV